MREIQTGALPRICKRKDCFNVAIKGYIYCKLHTKYKKPSDIHPLAPLHKWLYFIQQGENGPIKVGIAMSASARISCLQTGSPDLYKQLATILVPPRVEKVAHEYLADSRIRGEWFKPSEKLMELVKFAKNTDHNKLYSVLGFIVEFDEMPKFISPYRKHRNS